MTRGLLHRHEDGREHRHFTEGATVGGQTVPSFDGSEEHNHGFLSDPAASGPVVWREGRPQQKAPA